MWGGHTQTKKSKEAAKSQSMLLLIDRQTQSFESAATKCEAGREEWRSQQMIMACWPDQDEGQEAGTHHNTQPSHQPYKPFDHTSNTQPVTHQDDGFNSILRSLVSYLPSTIVSYLPVTPLSATPHPPHFHSLPLTTFFAQLHTITPGPQGEELCNAILHCSKQT